MHKPGDGFVFARNRGEIHAEAGLLHLLFPCDITDHVTRHDIALSMNGNSVP